MTILRKLRPLILFSLFDLVISFPASNNEDLLGSNDNYSGLEKDVSSLKKGWITKMAIFSMVPFLGLSWPAKFNLDGRPLVERESTESPRIVATHCCFSTALQGTSLFYSQQIIFRGYVFYIYFHFEGHY